MENLGNASSNLLSLSPSSPSLPLIGGSSRPEHSTSALRRRLISKTKSMKHETNQMEDPEDRSDWEKRPLRFPIRDEGDVVLRKIRAILNKISSVNFTKLRKRWLSLIPNDTDLLNEVIRLAVSKAIDEPMFQCIYSRLISNAISSKPSCIAKSLHRTLMNHIHVLLQRLTTDMEIAKFNRSMERELNFARHRKVMLNRFIAELFLESVCSAKFIAQKVSELMGQGRRSPEDTDEALECLCVILTFAGAKLEETKGSWLDDVLAGVNVREITNSPAVSKRIQFMVLDLVEMRSKGWVPHNKWWIPRVDIGQDEQDTDSVVPFGVPLPTASSQVNQPSGNQQRICRCKTSSEEPAELEWRVRSHRWTSNRSRNIDVKAVHEILNKVVPGNMETMVARLSSLLMRQDRAMSLYSDLILTHVSDDPLFTKIHAVLLARVSEGVPRFGRLITQKLPQFVRETPNSITGIWFLSEWYNLGMISVGEVIGIMNKFLRAESPPVESICAFLLLSGQKLNSVPRGRIWMKPTLRKLEGIVGEHEYRLKCFVWDILDLYNNNWERIRSLNWIHQFTPTDVLAGKGEDELERILQLLDTNYKVGLQILRTLYGTKERNIDKFTYSSIMWAIGRRDVEMMKLTGRAIRKLSGSKGILSPEKLRAVVGDLVMVTAGSTEAWNHLRIVMSELYSTHSSVP